MLRCHIDPHIPPKARNAITMGDGPNQLPGTAELTPYGVLIRAKLQVNGTFGTRDFLVPLSNIENIEFEVEDQTVTLAPRKRKDAETSLV